MIANDVLPDAFTRVHESLRRTLGDITPEELLKQPHPSIGWLAWRISRFRGLVLSSSMEPTERFQKDREFFRSC